jgi:phage gp46-like protein
VTQIRLREGEACAPPSQLLWDSVWVQEPVTLLTAEGGFADWTLSDPDEAGNHKGLRARATLHTATLILLFTDRRPEADAEISADDPRGWWGDSILFEGDANERPLGSLLWTLERGTLGEQTLIAAKEMAEDALSVLAAQGAVARTEVETEADILNGRLHIGVRHFARDGAAIYDQRFAALWGQHAKFPAAQRL